MARLVPLTDSVCHSLLSASTRALVSRPTLLLPDVQVLMPSYSDGDEALDDGDDLDFM